MPPHRACFVLLLLSLQLLLPPGTAALDVRGEAVLLLLSLHLSATTHIFLTRTGAT
jgi:hypothetical protein